MVADYMSCLFVCHQTVPVRRSYACGDHEKSCLFYVMIFQVADNAPGTLFSGKNGPIRRRRIVKGDGDLLRMRMKEAKGEKKKYPSVHKSVVYGSENSTIYRMKIRFNL